MCCGSVSMTLYFKNKRLNVLHQKNQFPLINFKWWVGFKWILSIEGKQLKCAYLFVVINMVLLKQESGRVIHAVKQTMKTPRHCLSFVCDSILVLRLLLNEWIRPKCFSFYYFFFHIFGILLCIRSVLSIHTQLPKSPSCVDWCIIYISRYLTS